MMARRGPSNCPASRSSTSRRVRRPASISHSASRSGGWVSRRHWPGSPAGVGVVNRYTPDEPEALATDYFINPSLTLPARLAHTFSGTTNPARYSRVNRASAALSPTNFSCPSSVSFLPMVIGVSVVEILCWPR